MKNRLITVIGVLVVVLGACETDIDVNADWKDITTVYSILDPAEKTQYVRINKAFLGEGNALEYAQIADSINYDTSYIEARIDEYLKGELVQSMKLKPLWIPRKNDPNSPFYNPNFPYVLVYMAQPKNFYKMSGNDTIWLNPDSDYHLEIFNRHSGKTVTASTIIVKDFNISRPLYNPSKPFLKILNTDGQNTIKWRAAVNGRRYQVIYRFYYKESPNPGDTVIKTTDYHLGVIKSQYTTGSEDMDVSFMGTSFYKYLGSSIPANPNVKRIAYQIELIIAVIPEEFNTYLEVNEPSSSIVQDRPEYTNIENGYGLFSSRYIKSRLYFVDSEMAARIKTYFQTIDGSFIVP